MNEHMHEWIPRALDWDHIDGVCCNVRGCGAQMDNEEMSARLNATERLSSSSAIQASRGQGLRGYVVKSLLAYADILEGKDD